MDSTSQMSQMGFEFGPGAFPVKICLLPDNVQDWLEADLDSSLSSIALLQAANQNGWSSKTSLDFSAPMEGETLQSCLEGLPASYRQFLEKAGETLGLQEARSTQWHTACSMRSFMEYPSAAAVCSLSDILETDVPRKYYLSAKAARGILRRAAKRGKDLPEMLHRALLQVAGGQSEPERVEGKTR